MILSDYAQTLLDKHSVFVMPAEINHEVFKLVVYVCTLYADTPLAFHCQGDGGDTTAGLGIVDIIRHHGQITGLLAGEANSCSGAIFAGCAVRYVYPHGSVGVHGCAMNDLTRVDASYARTWLRELDKVDIQIAQIFADASTIPYDDWVTKIAAQGGAGYTRVHAEDLVACGMAKPISERPR